MRYSSMTQYIVVYNSMTQDKRKRQRELKSEFNFDVMNSENESSGRNKRR